MAQTSTQRFNGLDALYLFQHSYRLKLWPRLASIGMFCAKHVRLP